MDLNSTLDLTVQSSCSDLTMYGEMINNPHILPYTPKKFYEFESRFKLIQQLYDNPLAATKIFTANDENSIQYAIKEIKKGKLKDNFAFQLAKNELSIHYSLSKKSKFIANVPEYFESDNSFYMVMEYCNNPNYFQYRLENVNIPLLKKLKQFDNEAKLKHYALNILYGLSDIHKNNVIHCDIKPDNFLLFTNDYELNTSTNEDDSENISMVDLDHLVKITDFGLAHIISQGNTKAYLKYPCGSFGYSAPEKKSDSYIDTSVDMWSFGVCLYLMAVAYKPTAIKNYKYGIFEYNVGSGPIPFLKSNWTKFDFPNLKNLIESCLEINPTKRITAEEAINHPWFDS